MHISDCKDHPGLEFGTPDVCRVIANRLLHCQRYVPAPPQVAGWMERSLNVAQKESIPSSLPQALLHKQHYINGHTPRLQRSSFSSLLRSMVSRAVPPAEFLAQALQGHGGIQMPYSDDRKWTVRQHLLDVVQEFPTLVLKAQTYTYPDGRSATLLMVEGTLPMYYQGVKYNIPVAIWLTEQYPQQAPLAYVVPTPDMIIKPRHSFVDASGVVNTPYLQHWSPQLCNLVDMGHDTSIQFGQDPPLFSKPPGWTPPPSSGPSHSQHPQQRPPPPQHQAQQQMGQGMHFQAENPLRGPPRPYPASSHASPSASPVPGQGYDPASIWAAAQQQSNTGAGGSLQGGPAQMGGGHRMGGGHHLGASQSQAQQQLQQQQLQQQQQARQQEQEQQRQREQRKAEAQQRASTEADMQAAFRKAAIAALTRRLQSSIAAANADAAAEMDSLFETQGKLTRREEEIQKGVAALQKERQALEACVLSMSGKTVALERWLEENEAKMPQGEINPDEAIVAADSLSQQALEAQAEDLAIEDTLYALERALTNGVITADAYLKQVRLICRKQFFVRALGMKVASKQHEVARHSQNRARHERSPQTQSVQMPQGDSWANTGILANPLQAR